MSDAAPDLRFVTMADVNAAVGAAARLMMTQPAFARLTFGDWARVLDGQVTRGHYGFVLDAGNQVLGFLGWALTTPAKAELWAKGGNLVSEECREGECLIVNAWVENSPNVHRFMVCVLRGLVRGRTMIYARRAYQDGRERIMRLPVDECVSSRAGRLPTSSDVPRGESVSSTEFSGAP